MRDARFSFQASLSWGFTSSGFCYHYATHVVLVEYQTGRAAPAQTWLVEKMLTTAGDPDQSLRLCLM